jgi:hypothetical protein
MQGLKAETDNNHNLDGLSRRRTRVNSDDLHVRQINPSTRGEYELTLLSMSFSYA